jgi:hypothetical protein
MTKRPIYTAAAVELQCPDCHEFIENQRDGSHLWTREDFQPQWETVTCGCCGTRVQVKQPERVKVGAL